MNYVANWVAKAIARRTLAKNWVGVILTPLYDLLFWDQFPSELALFFSLIRDPKKKGKAKSFAPMLRIMYILNYVHQYSMMHNRDLCSQFLCHMFTKHNYLQVISYMFTTLTPDI